MTTIRMLMTIAMGVAITACQPSGPGLTGAARDSFTQSATASCKQAAAADPRNAGHSADIISQYCVCYSNKLADNISEAELVELDASIKTNPTAAQARMQPRIDAASSTCANAVLNRAPH